MQKLRRLYIIYVTLKSGAVSKQYNLYLRRNVFMNGNDQMFQNNNMMFQGVPQGYYGTGAYYTGMQPNQVPQIKNNLSQEEIQKLMKKENEFSLALTETEILRAQCNHRWNEPRNGQLLDLWLGI